MISATPGLLLTISFDMPRQRGFSLRAVVRRDARTSLSAPISEQCLDISIFARCQPANPRRVPALLSGRCTSTGVCAEPSRVKRRRHLEADSHRHFISPFRNPTNATAFRDRAGGASPRSAPVPDFAAHCARLGSITSLGPAWWGLLDHPCHALPTVRPRSDRARAPQSRRGIQNVQTPEAKPTSYRNFTCPVRRVKIDSNLACRYTHLVGLVDSGTRPGSSSVGKDPR